MQLRLEQCIRDGFFHTVKKYVNTNNPNVKNKDFDRNKLSTWKTYLSRLCK